MRYLLFPFSLLFGLITYIRNLAYNRGWFKSYRSPLKTIVVGNLQVGGAGKTPMTAWLYHHLEAQFKIAILSRGYGRKTRGLLFAEEGVTPDDIGDEPYWYFSGLGAARVLVSEKRKLGLEFLEKTSAELVLLDDAYQHRAITADINLLLSDYNKPYFKDYPLPFGRMREYRTGDKRADFIVFTKCPADLSLEEKIKYISRSNPLDHQEVYFTTTLNGPPRSIKGSKTFSELRPAQILAVSGLADAADFHRSIARLGLPFETIEFGDHHHYSRSDIDNLIKALKPDTLIICTEKDAVKLKQKELYSVIPDNSVFELPLETEFLFNEGGKFLNALRKTLEIKHHKKDK